MNIGAIIVDVIVCAILLTTCYGAYKKGLLLTLYKIISIFLAIWIAWAINPIVKTTLQEHTGIVEFLDKNINEGITRSISNSLFTGRGDEAENENAVESLNVPKFVKNYLAEKATEDTSESGLANFISEKLTDICLTIISFLIVVVIVTIVLSLLKGILQMVSEIPVIESINKLAGVVFGAMYGALKIWLVFLILGLFINATKGGWIYDSISASYLGNWFYDNNLISYIILKFLG